MKYLQATHIKADIAARFIIQDDRLPAPYILTIRLMTLSRQVLTIIKFIWLFVLQCQIAFLTTKAMVNWINVYHAIDILHQAIHDLAVWFVQPVVNTFVFQYIPG